MSASTTRRAQRLRTRPTIVEGDGGERLQASRFPQVFLEDDARLRRGTQACACPSPTPAPPRAASRTERAACAPRQRRVRAGPAGRPASVTVAIEPWLPWAPTFTLQSMPRAMSGDSTLVNTRCAASQRSCGLNTLPTPVSGIGSIGMTCTGTAARSGVRSRTQARSSPGSTVAPRLQLHVGDRQLAGIGVGLADHRGEADGGMLEDDLLDRRRIDVVAAADHEVLGAAGDPEVAVGIETAEVAGVDPASSTKAPWLCASFR